jgi:hypothetical protein
LVVPTFGDIAEDKDIAPFITLPNSSPFSLFKIGWSPRTINVVQGNHLGLHVHSRS